MVASVALVSVLILGQADRFKDWPVVPLSNGYSDYLSVAKRLRLRDTSADQKMSSVERGRVLRTYLAGALETIEQGNRKTSTDGRSSVDFATLYPELAYLKQIGRAISDAADAEFADHYPDSGFRWLRVGLVYAERFPIPTTLHVSYSRDIALTMLRGVRTHTAALSTSQLIEIDGILATQEPTIEQYVRSTRETAEMVSRTIDRMAIDPKIMGMPPGENLDMITSFCRDKALSSMFKTDYRKVIEKHASAFRLPEHQWMDPDFNELEGSIWTRNMAVLEKHIENVFNMFGFMGLVEMADDGIGWSKTPIIARTRTRLMRLEIAIELYRQRAGHRPSKLTEISPKSLTIDPLTKLPFLYDGNEVWSKGLPQTGPIHLTEIKR